MRYKRIGAIQSIAFSTVHCIASAHPLPAITSPIPITEIQNYSNYPAPVKKLIDNAHDLSKENLIYLFGSSDPINKGMDCSGAIFFIF